MEGTLEVPSLGRLMCLGTLYDCRNHQIISPGETLWDQETMKSQRKVSEKTSHKVTLISSDDFNGKSKALEIDESLRASILADLVQTTGSARFLNDQQPPRDTCRLTVLSKATSTFEQLSVSQLGSCKIQNSDVFTEGKATHVVVGILYGANTFFLFDKTCGEEAQNDCLKSLIRLVEKFSPVPDEGGNAFDPNDANKVLCKVHCDLNVDSSSLDYKAAVKLLTGLPDMLKENAVPIKFILYPLYKIDSRAARVCKVVSNGLLSQAQEFVEGLVRCSARASEMAADPLCVSFPQFAEKFTCFIQLLNECKANFQKEFARVLPLIQGGSDGESVLKEMLQNEVSLSPFKLTELDAWLKSKRKELSAVRLYIKFLPDEVETIKSQESLDDILMDPSVDNVVYLTFRLAGKEEGYLSALSQYLATKKEAHYSIHQWCDDGSVMKFLRSKAKLFADFFQSNRQSTCTKFIVTGFPVGSSVQEETKAGGTVLLYEQGMLTQEDFEPPSKPTKPQCTVIDHNTVNVSWSPPQHGGNCVQRYIVKFKRFREKNPDGIYDEVYTEQADTCVSIKDLEPNETLEFWVAAICEVGVSPASDSSGKVTTLPASPPGKPEARPASASSITLEWKQPAQSGKQICIRSYTIKYGIVGNEAFNDWQPEIETGTSETRFTVRKLETNTSYVFRVVALYDSGVTSLPSDTSDVCSTNPVGQPGKPELSDVTASSVTMKWMDPTKVGKGVKLREYFIEYAEVDEQQSQSTGCNYKRRLTNGIQNQYTLADLTPNKTYISHVVLVCEDDFMAASQDSMAFTTLPAGPPTNVAANQISATDIKLTWSEPALISPQKAIKYYRVGYQVVDDTSPGEKEVDTNDLSRTFTIHEATPETLFKIRVAAVCGEDGTLGESSCAVQFTTRKLLKHEIRAHAKILHQGNSKNGKLHILEFPLKDVCRKPNSQSFSYGVPPKTQAVEHKVIMVVGVTGSGKSTLINAMANHILDIDLQDDFRYKIVNVHEARGSSQAHSQTQVLTSYTIYRNDYLSLPYTLTVIDTPGFGDTRGIERDKDIIDQIREFFLDSESHGIDHIDAIGFVVQASQARLTQTQKYVFDSILSLFGKDIADNIILLVTFADQGAPPVLAAVQEAGIPYTGSVFTFNNSAVFQDDGKNRMGSKRNTAKGNKGGMLKLYWDMGKQNMTDFLREIQAVESRSLVLTKEVLEERKRLEVAVQGLQPQIQAGICKLEELKKERQLLEQHETEIEANKDFKFVLDIQKSRKVDITGEFITNCSKCHFTCHYPCAIGDDSKKAGCAAMQNGECVVCPGKCAWDVHFNQQYKFEFYTEQEHRTYEEIEARYRDASGKKITVEQVIQKQVEDLKMVRKCVYKLMSDTRKSITRLEEIALKPNPLSTVEYVDILIESEKRSHRPGWKDRVAVLQDIRKEAEIMGKVKEENFDPFENYKNVFVSVAKDKKTSWFGKLIASWRS